MYRVRHFVLGIYSGPVSVGVFLLPYKMNSLSTLLDFTEGEMEINFWCKKESLYNFGARPHSSDSNIYYSRNLDLDL